MKSPSKEKRLFSFRLKPQPMQMKCLLLLALLTPVFANAQNEQKHTDLVDKFVKYYNKQQSDSICTLFPDERTNGKCPWRDASTDGTYGMNGKITSYKYVGEEGSGERQVTIYKIVSSKKGDMQLSFHVNEYNQFTIFLMQDY